MAFKYPGPRHRCCKDNFCIRGTICYQPFVPLCVKPLAFSFRVWCNHCFPWRFPLTYTNILLLSDVSKELQLLSNLSVYSSVTKIFNGVFWRSWPNNEHRLNLNSNDVYSNSSEFSCKNTVITAMAVLKNLAE